MAEITRLGRDWKQTFANLIRSVRTELVISSPYVTCDGVDFLLNNLAQPARDRVRVRFVTNLSPVNVCQGATDPHAFLTLISSAHMVEVIHLSRLHAKVYVADSSHAIVTSANLTRGGLELNHEYGVSLYDHDSVAFIRRDITAYSAIGAKLNYERLSIFCEIADRVRTTYRNQQLAISSDVRREFTRAMRAADDELVRNSLAGGAMHTVFARTILYLLKQHGALTTVQLHPMIEALHPELCDNSVDRIIDGQRFGKKWKHAVRTAQQQLKKRGLVDLSANRWVALAEDVPDEASS